MDKKEEIAFILIFTIAYAIFFTLLAYFTKNYEFVYYAIVISTLLTIIVLHYKQLHLKAAILWGLSILGLMHLAGGTINIYGIRLYDFWFIDGLLKYDNIIHAASLFVATLVAYNIISPHLDLKIKHHPAPFSLFLILIALGIGALNEILEFGAVVFLDAQEAVGDYFNNASDLVFNLIGSVIAVFFIHPYHKKRIAKKS